MAVLHNQKLAVKIGSLLAVILLFMVLVGFAGYYSMQKMAGMAAVLYEEQVIPIQLMDEVRLYSKDTETKLLQLIQTTDPAQRQAIVAKIDENTKAINERQEKFQKTSLDALEQQNWDELQKHLAEYRQLRADIIKQVNAGQPAEAFGNYVKNKAIFEQTLTPRKNIADHNVKKAFELYQESNAVAERATYTMMGVTLLALLISGFLGMLLARAICHPLSRMVIAVKAISQGDVQDKPRTFTSRDEMGQLADAIVAMRSDLRNIINQIRQSSQQVAASSTQLSSTAEQSALAATQVAIAITEVAEGSERQVRSVTNAAGTVENMSAGIEEVAASTGTVTQTAEKTSSAAREGLQAVEKAVGQMRSIESTVADSAEVVTHLGERSKDIGQIVETISNIAGQTNLLALNAAIEAARAGEQGRGFAVVADEVRRLAEQSDAAAQQIAGLITEIRQDTDRAVVAMNNGSQEVKVGTGLVSAAGQAFRDITGSISLISEQIKEVSMTMQHLAGNSQQIVTDVQEIDRTTRDTSQHAQTVSAATQEQSASMEEIASASRGLAELADELENVAARFRT
ncbi:MAG TPA: methyl-accepting chemotaxis protein [Patescibacteria group bacterium]|nr:methyl-accepting chemotaxis protein [Patescibacteria group bacterium]